MNINLKELVKRENGRIEWKDQVADIANLVKTIAAFSYDYSNLGGGYIVCGTREEKDENGFPTVNYTALTSSRLKEIENRAIAHYKDKGDPHASLLTEQLPCPGDDSKRILVLVISRPGNAHSY